MVSDDNILIYPDLKITFTVYTDDSDKHLGAVISHNNKPIDFIKNTKQYKT